MAAKFQKIDYNKLPKHLKASVDAYTKARDSMEADFNKHGQQTKRLGPNERFAFGYRFGDISIATVGDSPTAGKFSF
jgi:hypothetical protein